MKFSWEDNMKRVFGSLKIKIFVLAVLVGLTFQLGWNINETKACEKCVELTGGLCVGCMEDASGSPSCMPMQETCSCNIAPGSCTNPN